MHIAVVVHLNGVALGVRARLRALYFQVFCALFCKKKLIVTQKMTFVGFKSGITIKFNWARSGKNVAANRTISGSTSMAPDGWWSSGVGA